MKTTLFIVNTLTALAFIFVGVVLRKRGKVGSKAEHAGKFLIGAGASMLGASINIALR